MMEVDYERPRKAPRWVQCLIRPMSAFLMVEPSPATGDTMHWDWQGQWQGQWQWQWQWQG